MMVEFLRWFVWLSCLQLKFSSPLSKVLYVILMFTWKTQSKRKGYGGEGWRVVGEQAFAKLYSSLASHLQHLEQLN